MSRYRQAVGCRWWALAGGTCVTLAAVAVGVAGLASAQAKSVTTAPHLSGRASTPKGTPFTYLMVLDETGPTKIYAPSQIFSSKSAAAYLNKSRDGILGHPVKVKFLNDNGDPAVAVSAIDKYLSTHPKPNLIYPGSISDDIAAALPIVTRAGVFTIANEQGIPGAMSKDANTKYPLQFTTVFPTNGPASAAAAWFKSRGMKKVGLAVVDEPYDIGDASILKSVLKKDGIAATEVTFPTTSVDPSPELSALKADNVDAIYCGCLGTAIGYSLTARSALGWNVPMLASLAAAAQDITKLVPKSDLNGVYELTNREDTAKYASLPASKYLVTHGFAKAAGVAPMSVAANSWDPLMLAADAAVKAKSIVPAAMAKALVSAGGSGTCDKWFLHTPCYKFPKGSHVPTYPTGSFSIVPVATVKNGIVQ